jgi:hypothetical protein
VDNALDARVGERAVQVKVTYNVREGWIRVSDDGGGMSRAELADALVLGLSNKGSVQIGKFGLGMKTACTALGDRFEIWTATSSGTFAHIADYDERQFLTKGEWTMPIHKRKKDRDHGTTVTIQSERLYHSLHQSLTRNLGWTFRHFLLDGLLELDINGVPVEPASYEVDPSSVMPFSGMVADKPVTGWVGLLTKSSQRGWYGFGLVRHRRIIRRHEKLGFQPHPQTARVVGELHLDEFDTNNLKTDFIRETTAWRELEEWVSKVIEPVLAQSRALAHAGMLDLKIRTKIDAERRRLLDELDDEELNLPGLGRLASPGGVSPRVALAVGPLHMAHVFVEGGADLPYVQARQVARLGEADLTVVETNMAHPAASQGGDRSVWALHNLAEVAATELASAEERIELKSILLAQLLGEKGLRRELSRSARGLEPQAPPEPVLAQALFADG